MFALTKFSQITKVSSMALLVSFGNMAIAQQEAPAALVSVDKVRHESVAKEIWLPGTVISRTDSNIAPEVAGRITWMADVGEMVKRGDVIARLDDRMLQLNALQHNANIARWEARVTLLSNKQKRIKAMLNLNNSSQDQFEEIIAELKIAKQELAQAKVNQKLTAYQIDQSDMKAPFDAMIVERLQSPGEYTAVGKNALRIVDTTNIEAVVRAPLSAVPYIAKNMQVQVKYGASNQMQPIRAIVPVGNAQSRMMEVRVSLSAQDFAIGGAVRVALPHSNSYQALTVPRDALVLRKSGVFVYTIDDELIASQVPVKTGLGAGTRIEVEGELLASNPVVIRGAERLRDGQKVRFATPDSEDASALANL